MTRISASVVLYSTPQWQLARLIDCLRHSTLPVRLYIVDNSPHPIQLPSLDGIDAICLRPARNGGYGSGHNLALRQSVNTVDFHFVINPDIAFGRDELGKMVRFIEGDTTIGLVMPRVIYPDGRLQRLCKLLPSPLDLFLRRFPLGVLSSITEQRKKRFELGNWEYDRILDVPYLSGCFMLLRTSALREVGLFDERFFMYMEDVDLSRRIHRQFRTVYFPEATVIHDHAQESYKSLRAFRIHNRSAVQYFNKWGWIWDPERRKLNREALSRIDQLARDCSSSSRI